MTYNPDIHHRHSTRLKDYDYSQAGAYFVTICTWQHECLFGEIVNGEMALNDMGRIVVGEWEKTSAVRKNVELDVYAIMPNHFHAIFLIHETVVPDTVGAAKAGESPTRPYGNQIECPVGATPVARPGATGDNVEYYTESRAARTDRATHRVAPTGPVSGSIGAIMAQFKSIVTKHINTFRINPGCPVWQNNYYDRVIRDENELSRAREYIVNNPLKWELDKENPVNGR